MEGSTVSRGYRSPSISSTSDTLVAVELSPTDSGLSGSTRGALLPKTHKHTPLIIEVLSRFGG